MTAGGTVTTGNTDGMKIKTLIPASGTGTRVVEAGIPGSLQAIGSPITEADPTGSTADGPTVDIKAGSITGNGTVEAGTTAMVREATEIGAGTRETTGTGAAAARMLISSPAPSTGKTRVEAGKAGTARPKETETGSGSGTGTGIGPGGRIRSTTGSTTVSGSAALGRAVTAPRARNETGNGSGTGIGTGPGGRMSSITESTTGSVSAAAVKSAWASPGSPGGGTSKSENPRAEEAREESTESRGRSVR